MSAEGWLKIIGLGPGSEELITPEARVHWARPPMRWGMCPTSSAWRRGRA